MHPLGELAGINTCTLLVEYFEEKTILLPQLWCKNNDRNVKVYYSINVSTPPNKAFVPPRKKSWNLICKRTTSSACVRGGGARGAMAPPRIFRIMFFYLILPLERSKIRDFHDFCCVWPPGFETLHKRWEDLFGSQEFHPSIWELLLNYWHIHMNKKGLHPST